MRNSIRYLPCSAGTLPIGCNIASTFYVPVPRAGRTIYHIPVIYLIMGMMYYSVMRPRTGSVSTTASEYYSHSDSDIVLHLKGLPSF
ncbi:hypothetical protein L210DRAFT_3563360 [Boletus edulis BED1]|uniref:Uncharacterized protein n=1 Tax=Boletus edulis BED1 TaxID=1328754 RepID=A0AAD4G8S4_BOLED|nr:hypothetical protein L210DRAFT_3563360 [Boletus edulis BED1]